MKKLIVFKILTLMSIFLYGQEFKMKLWFNDAIGNKDSIEIGYDLLATDGIDASFGEANIISTPWSSDFEVRAGDAATSLTNLYITSPATIHTKKQIISKTCNFFHLIKIAVNCDNFPLVIKWDTSVFSGNSCRYSSFITSGTVWGGDWFDGVMAFMNPLHNWYSKDSLVISEIGNPSSPVFYSQNGQEIIQLNVSFGNTMPPTSINENRFERVFEIFPNPTNDRFFIKSHIMDIELYDLKIFDIIGKLLYHKILENNIGEAIEINGIGIGNGIYQIMLSDNNGNTFKKKLIINK